MDAGLSALLGALVGAAAVVAAQWLSFIHQRRLAREDWLRNRLHDVYAEAIRHTAGTNYAERDQSISLVILYFPPTQPKELASFLEKARTGAVRRHDILEIAARDTRLRGDGLAISREMLPSYDEREEIDHELRMKSMMDG